jgi:hypothetical protein
MRAFFAHVNIMLVHTSSNQNIFDIKCSCNMIGRMCIHRINITQSPTLRLDTCRRRRVRLRGPWSGGERYDVGDWRRRRVETRLEVPRLGNVITGHVLL